MIVRSYRCEQCKQEFDMTFESGNDPDPVCPNPDCRDIEMVWQPKRFAIGGSVASAAVDVTQKIIEEDYGVANMQDGMREGDAAFKSTPKQGAELQAEERVMRELAAQKPEMLPAAQQFFSGSPGGPPSSFVAGAVAAAKSQHEKRYDPISLLHQAGQKGELGLPFKPLFKG